MIQGSGQAARTRCAEAGLQNRHQVISRVTVCGRNARTSYYHTAFSIFAMIFQIILIARVISLSFSDTALIDWKNDPIWRECALWAKFFTISISISASERQKHIECRFIFVDGFRNLFVFVCGISYVVKLCVVWNVMVV